MPTVTRGMIDMSAASVRRGSVDTRMAAKSRALTDFQRHTLATTVSSSMMGRDGTWKRDVIVETVTKISALTKKMMTAYTPVCDGFRLPSTWAQLPQKKPYPMPVMTAPVSTNATIEVVSDSCPATQSNTRPTMISAGKTYQGTRLMRSGSRCSSIDPISSTVAFARNETSTTTVDISGVCACPESVMELRNVSMLHAQNTASPRYRARNADQSLRLSAFRPSVVLL